MAVSRAIPVRVGLVSVRNSQRVAEARDDLLSIGVRDIATDDLRKVGRGSDRLTEKDPTQLCGSCADGVVAISPNGEVWPCVFARWMPLGNVLETELESILAGDALRAAQALIGTGRSPENACNPKCCPNTMCDPQCSPSCSPSCRPANNCTPAGNCSPNY
jgi:MoaA/NifB/PqqE/SkfB family radical SAM enzyme